MPVKTIASPASSAAAITSSSRIEPPGWITAVAPASTAASRPSAKGKKASEATAEPIVRGSGPAGLLGGVLRLPGGDAGGFEPVHLAGADAGGGAVLGIDDRVRLDVLGDRPGEQAVGQLLLGRRALGHDLEVVAADPAVVARLDQPAAGDRLERQARARAGSGSSPVSSSRRFFFAAKTARAASSASGATTTSVKIAAIASAVGAVERPVDRDDAAEGRDGVAGEGRRIGLDAGCRAVATPQGLACLTMTQVGSASRNSATSSSAASASL